MLRSWRLAALVLVLGAVLAVPEIVGGAVAGGAVTAVAFLVLAWLTSPLAYPRSGGPDDRPVIYWRPGCPFCMRLRLMLWRDGGRARWVNIWTDADAAAAVRAVADGNETVPTVIDGAESFVNPDPAWLRARLRAT